jgi:hypothetical protein
VVRHAIAALTMSKSVGSSGVAAWTPAVIIAGCALLFTVGSFWWLNARRGRLKSFEPHTFSAVITRDKVRFVLPLVLHNTGAVPIIIQSFRMRFLDERDSVPLPWVTTRLQVRPQKDDWAFPAVFSVGGRTAYQIFVEFGVPGAPSLGFLLNAKDYQVRLEAKLGHRKKWRHILKFTFRAAKIDDPEHYITYENSPDYLSEDERKEVQLGLEFAQMGSKAKEAE